MTGNIENLEEELRRSFGKSECAPDSIAVAKDQNSPRNVVEDRVRRPDGMTQVVIQALGGGDMTDLLSSALVCYFPRHKRIAVPRCEMKSNTALN